MVWDALMPAVAWLGGTSFSAWLGMSTARIAWLFTFHVMGLTLLLGAVILTSAHLLGLFQPHKTSAHVRAQMRPVLRLGLAISLVTGAIIFTGGAVDYYQGYWLRLKLVLLAMTLLFHVTVYRAVSGAPAGRLPVVAYRATGASMLILWFGVAWAGRAIAFL